MTDRRGLWLVAVLAALAGLAVLMARPEQARAHTCYETVNPAGNPAVGDNGVPGSLFNGDAVPGGKHTSPGVNGKGPINSDGFYVVWGFVYSGDTQIRHPSGDWWWDYTTIKYTEWGNKSIKITSSIGGPNSVITYHVQAPDDLYVGGENEERTFCGVPPPPF